MKIMNMKKTDLDDIAADIVSEYRYETYDEDLLEVVVENYYLTHKDVYLDLIEKIEVWQSVSRTLRNIL